MTRRALPPLCYRKGRGRHVYYYPNGARGKGYRILAEPGTPAFHAELAKAALGTLPTPSRTVKKLVEHYRNSDRWQELAPKTRHGYARDLAYLIEKLGHVDPRRISTVHVVRMRDALRDTPADANHKVSILKTLLEHGRLIGWVKENVAKGVPTLRSKRPQREPWPPHMIEAYRAEADGLAVLVFEMCLGTGQRIGDVLKMTWSDWTPEGIRVRQSKTGKSLTVPPTTRLQAILDQTPRVGLTIISQPNGRRVSYQLAWKVFAETRARIGAERWDLHSLRYAAASEIAALPGMTWDHVRAITGHTSAKMAERYAGVAFANARAKEAQKGRT